MRHAIGTAPKDGNVVILEDYASGTCDVAHWSTEAGEWVGENGEPSKVTPSHWYPVPRDKNLPQEHDGSSNPAQVGPSTPPARWLFAASSITATLIAAALTGLFFEQEPHLPSQDSRQTNLPALEADQASVQARVQEAAQAKHAAEASVAEARQSLEKEQRAEALAYELAEARRAIDGLNLQLQAEAAKTTQSLGQERDKTAGLVQEATTARQELTEQHRHAIEEERARSVALASELAMAHREIEMQAALLRKADDEAVQVKQAAEASAPEARQSLELEKEQRTEVLANELAEARRAINELNLQLRAEAANSAQLLGQERHDATAARQELTASTEQHRRALEEERARGAALASELALARLEIETNVALLNKARETTAELQQERDRAEAEATRSAQLLEEERQHAIVATASTAQDHRALEEERARGAALASELAMARREIETNIAGLNKSRDDAAQFKQTAEKQTAENTTAELQQERDSADALSRELTMARESAQRAFDARTTLERTANSEITQVTQAVEAAAPEQLAAALAQGGPKVARLMVRARALLDQGNIAAARIVLEHAAEMGSTQATFMLAETYDPAILSAWGTYGTRGEVAKARELYAKAHTGGIQEAKTRFDALNQ
jgi:hypothetical protein